MTTSALPHLALFAFNRPQWVHYRDAEIYLRVSHRSFGHGLCRMLDLATIARASRADNIQDNPLVQSTGFLREFMDTLEGMARSRSLAGVYVENVFNEWMPAWLEARGYTQDDPYDGGGPPCYFLLFEDA